MAFYRQDPEMAYCLKGLLDRFEKEGRPNLQENIAITCIRYDKQNPSPSNGYGTGWNANINFYPASVVKLILSVKLFTTAFKYAKPMGGVIGAVEAVLSTIVGTLNRVTCIFY